MGKRFRLDNYSAQYNKVSGLQNLKVCFIAGTFGQGGAERQLYYMLCTLLSQGANATVCCLTKDEFWEKEIRALGIPVIWVGKQSNRMLRLFNIVRCVHSIRPDILQSAHFYTNLYATIAGRILQIAATGRIFGMLNLKLPRFIAGNSRSGIENAQKLGMPDRKLFFLPNVIDIGLFALTLKKTSSRVVLLAAGRLVEQKRLDKFIRLLANLKTTSPVKVTGLIAGDGPLLASLKEKCRLAGLTGEELQFLGKMKNMAPVYDEADVFILTSDWEGTPNVVMEAMASGLPVVATNVGGINDLISNGENGYLIEKDNEEALFKKTYQLIHNSALRDSLGTKAREFIRQHHALEILLHYLKQLYGRAIQSRTWFR